MFRETVLGIVALSCLSPVVAGTDVNVSGHFLGGYNYFDQKAVNRAQFDFAANIDFELTLSEKLKGIIQLQTGAGDGSMGYVGPGAELTDINLEYTHDSGAIFTFGSYDMPFGQETQYLTNNADSTNSVFLNNSLLYSALAGPVGTLNTLGLKTEKSTAYGDITVSVSNGTGENAANENDTFGALLGVGTDKLLDNLYVSATYMASDDSPDTSNELSNSFGTELSAWVIDAKYDFSNDISLKAYVGALTYDDGSDATKDGVQVAMLELNQKTESRLLGARVSVWQPEDSNGNAAGMSAQLPFPGYSTSTTSFSQPVDTTITRFQVGGGIEFEPNVWLKGEAFVDQVDEGENVNGVILYVNAGF
jgi:hypothetical protein